MHYELSELNFCYKYFDTSVYIDIGANIGNHANYFISNGSRKVVAFEPSVKNFTLLEKNALGAELYRYGLGDKNSTEKFVTYTSCMGNSNLLSNFDLSSASSIQNWGTGVEVEEVEIRTLDSFALSEATMIKIDVEGAEMKVLLGSRETLLRLKPAVWIEVHLDETLSNAGFMYTRKDIDNFFSGISYRRVKTPIYATNFYYVPKSSYKILQIIMILNTTIHFFRNSLKSCCSSLRTNI